jgi:hypothetical protein
VEAVREVEDERRDDDDDHQEGEVHDADVREAR